MPIAKTIQDEVMQRKFLRNKRKILTGSSEDLVAERFHMDEGKKFCRKQ